MVDVIEALTDSPDSSTYWRVLKNRLKKEGNESVTICNAFKLTDEWKRCGVTTQQYASLTDIVTMAWPGKAIRSLRDNRTNDLSSPFLHASQGVKELHQCLTARCRDRLVR